MFFAEWLQKISSSLCIKRHSFGQFQSLTYTNRWCWLLHKYITTRYESRKINLVTYGDGEEGYINQDWVILYTGHMNDEYDALAERCMCVCVCVCLSVYERLSAQVNDC